MSPHDALRSRYEETPYRDQVFDGLDLARLLGIGRLFQLGPKDSSAEGLRVLDLACASGAHIRSQAALYPSVQFKGIDFSSSEVEAGTKAIAESGLDNVEIQLADLRSVDIAEGEYDLVLCHGAFSWVPDEVKERIFELSRTALKPTGMAAIAYLTYPGWKQREAIRELLAFRVRELEDPDERLRESALMLRLLHAGYAAQENDPHAQSLMAVVESMQQSASNVFLHDELGSIHDPCYFVQFVEWAAEWGLRYLAEEDLDSMRLDGLPESAAGLLQNLAPNFIETQQLIDFMVNRSGRTSILVRQDAPVTDALSSDALGHVSYLPCLRPIEQSTADREGTGDGATSHAYMTRHGGRIEIDDPRLLGLISQLLDRSPEPTPFEELRLLSSADTRTRDFSQPGLAALVRVMIANGWIDPILPIERAAS